MTEEKPKVEEKAEEEKEVIVKKPKTEEEEKDVVTKEAIEEEEKEKKPARKKDVVEWIPKTATGKKVKAGEITDIDKILDNGERILEVEIIDKLLPNAESDLLLIGQAKGKFGGGKRRAFRQTQKKTQEGNKPKFTTYAVIGNKDGYIGVGYGKAKETVPAREKAFRNAKLNVFKIRRGCGSWECNCKTPHTIPFKIEGKCGSVRVILIPAPKGTGLCVERECGKILELAGVKDVWAKILGQSKTKMNTIKACELALKSLMTTRVNTEAHEKLSIADGNIAAKAEE
ncbi:30S ribosomal protein S5 [Candidatus Woesearchaeota archaeon CG10_big_fil_rev_8_21_14_0_10_34_8]|nr:MAG: 30S ribosomal protein S5 [Candidatus Woesearchaeota archaeon CG10_big_fil_rev_8_21_14_0_10_34_8]